MPIHDWTRVDAGIFHDFHLEWISAISRSLNTSQLPPDCYAMIERDPVVPIDGAEDGMSGGLALSDAPPKVRFRATSESEKYARRRSQIAIRHRSGDRILAVIEIVSPGNKGNQFALRSFLEKGLDLLDAGIHLMILDLFPPGPRDPQGIHAAFWSNLEPCDFELPSDQPLTLVSYASGEVKQAFIEPVGVGDSLPEMPLFLSPTRYIPIPLEPTYRSAFDAVPSRWQSELE